MVRIKEFRRLVFLLRLEQRGLRNIKIPLVDNLRHISPDERRPENLDVTPVGVTICEKDDLVIPKLVDIKFFSDAAAECRKGKTELVILDDVSRTHIALDSILHLSKNWQYGLRLRIASLFTAAGC